MIINPDQLVINLGSIMVQIEVALWICLPTWFTLFYHTPRKPYDNNKITKMLLKCLSFSRRCLPLPKQSSAAADICSGAAVVAALVKGCPPSGRIA